MAEIENLKIGANGTIHIVGNENIITEEWEASKTYVKDKSYVIREHKLYVCNITHTSTSSFDPTKWTEITVIGAIDNALDMTDTASGAIATFESEYALPLRDLEIEINAVQESGTPTPSSPKAISGFTGANIKVCGANLWNEDWELGNISTSDGQPSTSTLYIRSKVYCACKGGATYYCKSHSTSQLVIYWYDANDTYLGFDVCTNTTKTAPANAVKFKIRCEVTTYSNDISINYPATDTAYNAYNANSTTAISWNDEAGTVYGGSLDVTSGVLTVTHGIITFDGSDDEIWNDGTYRYSIEIANCERTVGRLEVLCNRGVFVSSGGSEGTVFATNKYLYYYPPTSITSLADFKTWLGSNNLVVVYPLETPVTYQLTPTQISAIVGTNNVFTDTNGNTSVVYACLLKDYVGDLSQLTTTDKSSLVGAVNEVNEAISYKEYVVQIGTSLWNGVYYAETNVATDVSNYGEILSALVIDESEQSDFSSHTNRACFCQVITPNVIRLYSPQASNASGHYVKYRVTFSANAVNRT